MRLPSVLFLIAAAGLTSAAAPAAHAGGLPVCNAKHKRPANAYGSVLSEGLKPALAAAAPADPPSPAARVEGVAKAPDPATPKPQQVSRAEQRASFAPCGSDRG